MSSYFLHAAVLYSSTLAHINFSLILNLYSMTPFLTAIAFYMMFKERLHKMHLIGMFLILGCITCTSLSQTDFSKHPNPHKDPDEPKDFSVLIPIGIALLATIFFTVINVISRYTVLKGTITS